MGAEEDKDQELELRIKRRILDDLEETYHGEERRRKLQPQPKLFLLERWGPLVISLLTFLALITIAWTYGERISRIEGSQSEIRREVGYYSQSSIDRGCDSKSVDDVKRQVELYRVYVETLRSSMLARGIKVDPLPDLTAKKKEN